MVVTEAAIRERGLMLRRHLSYVAEISIAVSREVKGSSEALSLLGTMMITSEFNDAFVPWLLTSLQSVERPRTQSNATNLELGSPYAASIL